MYMYFKVHVLAAAPGTKESLPRDYARVFQVGYYLYFMLLRNSYHCIELQYLNIVFTICKHGRLWHLALELY